MVIFREEEKKKRQEKELKQRNVENRESMVPLFLLLMLNRWCHVSLIRKVDTHEIIQWHTSNWQNNKLTRVTEGGYHTNKLY